MTCPFCRDWVPPELWDHEHGTCEECVVYAEPAEVEDQ